MNTMKQTFTLKELRAEAQRLGITADSAGQPIDELLRAARDSEDPLGYLAIYAPSGGAAAGEKQHESETDLIIDEPIGDVSAPIVLAKITTLAINVPVIDADMDHVYLRRHIDARLTHRQAQNLRRLFLALDADGLRLDNKRPIVHAADAIRWLLEQLG
jgi:hypothetical protein